MRYLPALLNLWSRDENLVPERLRVRILLSMRVPSCPIQEWPPSTRDDRRHVADTMPAFENEVWPLNDRNGRMTVMRAAAEAG